RVRVRPGRQGPPLPLAPRPAPSERSRAPARRPDLLDERGRRAARRRDRGGVPEAGRGAEDSVSRARLDIDQRVAGATTPPAEVYAPPAWPRTFWGPVPARAWPLVGDAVDEGAAGTVTPTTLLPGCLDEPLLLSADAQGRLHCLSNVCTH